MALLAFDFALGLCDAAAEATVVVAILGDVCTCGV